MSSQEGSVNIDYNNAYDPQYYEWIKCVHIANLEQRQRRKRKIIAVLCLILTEDQCKKKKKKRFWASTILKKRREYCFYGAIFPTLHLEDLRFHNYLCMSATQLEQLLHIVGKDLQKQYVVRAPIAAQERLIVTLRYVASGDSLTSMSYQYLLGLPTACNIVKETCSVIWDKLQPIVLPSTLKEKDWLQIAEAYNEKWNFPHCIGAIDAKHVVIQCPNNAGSAYFNYKDSHSVVLLAICDAQYIFCFLDIGGYGRRSDGGIFQESEIGQKFNSNQMNVPSPSPISQNGELFPYCLVGDEAFPLKAYLLRPFPGKGNLDQEKRFFNYRQSRARKTIEDSFGILAARSRIYRKSIILSVPSVIKLIKATVCLHNWLRLQDLDDSVLVKYVSDRQCNNSAEDYDAAKNDCTTLQDVTHAGCNNTSRAAVAIRHQFLNYFNGEGSVDWQYNYI